MKWKFLFLFFLLSETTALAQEIEKLFLQEYTKVYVDLVVRNKDGAILIPGLNGSGQILIEEIDQNGILYWARTLPQDLDLLDVCTSSNDSCYLFLLRKSGATSGFQSLVFIEFNRHESIFRENQLSLNSSFLAHSGTIVADPAGMIYCVLLDTASKKVSVLHYNPSDTLINCDEYQIPYPEIHPTALSIFRLEKNDYILTDHKAKWRIAFDTNGKIGYFDRTAYGFLGSCIRHPSVQGITAFIDERNGLFDRWIPVRTPTTDTALRHLGSPSIQCMDATTISGCLHPDSSAISYVSVVNTGDSANLELGVRIQFFSFDMQKTQHITIRPLLINDICATFHQITPDGKIIVYVVASDASSDQLFVLRSGSFDPALIESACIELVQDGVKTSTPIYPWSRSHTFVTPETSSATNLAGGSYQLSTWFPGWQEVCSNAGVSDAVFIPNSFSPNGDQLNDEFYPIGETILHYEIEIYTSLGAKVSHITDEPWSGIDIPSSKNGTYLYRIRVTLVGGEKQEFKGMLSVIR